MMTTTDNPRRGAWNTIPPPQIPSSANAYHQSEGNYRMLSKSISIEYDVSIQGMLQLDDMDNILISHEVFFRRYHDMMLTRLTSIDKRGVKIHVRPGLSNVPIETYLLYAQQGVQIVVWQDDPEMKIQHSDNLTIVHIPPPALNREGFVVIKAPITMSTRMLATWEKNNQLSALLVTNSHTIQSISDHLDAIVQSALS